MHAKRAMTLFTALVSVTILADSAAGSPQSSRPAGAAAASVGSFQRNVAPILKNVCANCHNDRLASGGLNVLRLAEPKALSENRDTWEAIARQVRGGEMPPRGIPRPAQAELEAFVKHIEGVFDQQDRASKPDPGRVTARRLNRSEYSNTIRDLLGLEFRADRAFPTDDSGDGFDNIADVLTISPLLMEKYLTAAERIATRALGLQTLSKPMEISYSIRALLSGAPPPGTGTIRRIDTDTIEVTHRFDFDGEYDIRIGLPGERGAGAKPVSMQVWLDGKVVDSRMVETKPSGLVYFDPFSEEQFRLSVSEGEHVLRVGFVNDDFLAAVPEKDYYNRRKNKFPDTVTLVGPFPSKVEKASRQKILICDPKTGQACVQKIVATLARRAYRRPVAPAEVATLMRFVSESTSKGHDLEYGIRTAL